TRSPPGEVRPKTAQFYYNGRAIGEGRQGFEVLLAQVRALPKGASIIWGPNYARCGACSGSEPPCLAKHLYPDLWGELEKISTDRHLTLSSSYPEPHVRGTRKPEFARSQREIFAHRPPNDLQTDAVIDWEIGEEVRSALDLPAGTEWWARRLHRFS